MPSVAFLIALLYSCLTTRAETVSYKIPVNDLWTHCSFGLHGYVYNLCPIMGSSNVVHVPDELQGGRSDSDRYVLALGGFWMEDGVLENPGCDEETWVCFTEKVEGMRERSQPVVQNSKSSNLIVEFRGEPDHDPSLLQISFHGAKKDLDIVMLCSEVEQVELINVGRGALRFMWASRYGCPRDSTRRLEADPTLNTWEDQEQSDDDGEEEDQLLPSDSRKARKGIAFVIVFVVFIVICGSALALSTRARHFALELFQKASYAVVPVVVEVGSKLRPIGQSLNTLTSKAISAVPFRTNGDNLVRWAQEDMALESDIMVNGSARANRLDEESWDGSDEYIPLATSPRSRFPSYGSTPEGPTLREGAVMGRMRKYFKI